jgi:plasmid maintenance system antidote protein VapI
MVEFKPDWTTEVHEHLSEIMEVRELSCTDIASSSGLAEDVVKGILAGSDIDDHQAAGLEKATGMGAVVWLNIQKAAKAFQASRV